MVEHFGNTTAKSVNEVLNRLKLDLSHYTGGGQAGWKTPLRRTKKDDLCHLSSSESAEIGPAFPVPTFQVNHIRKGWHVFPWNAWIRQ